jgi:branched-chain amino acid transport system substrate-binding protein
MRRAMHTLAGTRLARTRRGFLLAVVLATTHAVAAADPAEKPPLAGHTVRLAFIDPLSGPAADIGRNSLRSWEFMAERMSGTGNPAGVRFTVAGFDNKGSPQESLNALKVAIDQGFRYILQGNSSAVAAAISDAVTRHNLRHPDQTVLYINYAAMDPALTNEKCSYWHFRIDADTSMKMRAMTTFMAEQPELRAVYLLNQNYAHGQQFSLHFREAMAQLRPDVQIVGDELHPPFQGLNFTAHARRIKASGAQALATGNWGADLRDLVQALQKEGLTLPVYAYYAALKGVPTTLAQTGERLPVYQVAYHHTNQEGPVNALAADFRQRHGEDFTVYASYDGIAMLAHAMADVRSTDPARVAPRLSGMIFRGFNGPVHLRAEDHQLQKGQYISRWQKVDARHPRGAEGTGYTFAPVRFMEGADLRSPVRCEMVRP